MAQRTAANIPGYTEAAAVQQDQVRPEIQPAINNYLAAQQLTDARKSNDLTAKLQQARLQMDQLKLDPEIAQLKAQTGLVQANTDLATRKTPTIPSSSLKGILEDNIVKNLPAELPQEAFDSLVKLAGTKETAKGKIDVVDAKQQAKIKVEAPKAKAALDNVTREFDNMIAEANAIKTDPGLSAATGKTSYIPGILNEGKRNVGARIDTLKAKTLLNVLSAMKQLSSQGASGFGALSEKEGETIKNSISSLDTKQDTPEFQASLDRFIAEIQAKKDNYLNTYNSTYGDSTAPTDKKAALRAKLGL